VCCCIRDGIFVQDNGEPIDADTKAWISGDTLSTLIGVVVDNDETAALTTSGKNNFDLI
jgi:hypothetical protein